MEEGDGVVDLALGRVVRIGGDEARRSGACSRGDDGVLPEDPLLVAQESAVKCLVIFGGGVLLVGVHLHKLLADGFGADLEMSATLMVAEWAERSAALVSHRFRALRL